MARPWQGIIGSAHTPATFAAYLKTIRLTTWRPEFCVLHNTGVPTVRDWPKVPGPVRMHNLESYYRDVQHWSAGPHLFCAPDFIWLFTPLWIEGVHSPSWNHRAWGIESVGDYDSEPLNQGVYRNVIAALALLHPFGGFSPDTLRYHREDPQTTHYGCPGKNLGNKASVIQAIKSAMNGGSSIDFTDVESGSSSTATSHPILKRGSRATEDVKLLQHLLGMQDVNAPGVFGPMTERAVKDFQLSHGIDPADGIVGQETWRELEGESG